MGQHKYNPTAIKAKNGEIEPKKKPIANPITKTELYEMMKWWLYAQADPSGDFALCED